MSEEETQLRGPKNQTVGLPDPPRDAGSRRSSLSLRGPFFKLRNKGANFMLQGAGGRPAGLRKEASPPQPPSPVGTAALPARNTGHCQLGVSGALQRGQKQTRGPWGPPGGTIIRTEPSGGRGRGNGWF